MRSILEPLALRSSRRSSSSKSAMARASNSVSSERCASHSVRICTSFDPLRCGSIGQGPRPICSHAAAKGAAQNALRRDDEAPARAAAASGSCRIRGLPQRARRCGPLDRVSPPDTFAPMARQTSRRLPFGTYATCPVISKAQVPAARMPRAAHALTGVGSDGCS
jgi:hypothetical protein